MRNYKILLILTILLFFVPQIAKAAYNPTWYDCTAQCGGFLAFCKVVVGPSMDFSFDVDQNISARYGNCNDYPSEIGDDIDCLVNKINMSMSSHQIVLNFDQVTSKNIISPDVNSEIFFQDSNTLQVRCNHSSCLAVTNLKVDTSTVNCSNFTVQAVAAKIGVDDSIYFRSGPRDVWYWIEIANSDYVSRPALLHEFGHALGIGHINTTLDTMNPNYPAGGGYAFSSISNPIISKYDPGPSFMEALDALHGNVTLDDVAATPFLLFEGNTVINSKYLAVCPGDTITYKAAIQNLGDYFRTPFVKFYLSNNSNITSSDTLLYSDDEILFAHSTKQIDFTMTIPPTIQPNTSWFLGYTISYSNIDINIKNNQAKFSNFKNIDVLDCD